MRAAALGGVLVLGAAATPTLDDAFERLRSMPTDRRIALSDDLDAFRRLSRGERSGIEDLDRQLQQAQPEVRERYNEALRIYQLWLASLSEEDRNRISALPTSQRMGVVRELLQGSDSPDAPLNLVLGRCGSPAAPSLLDQAYWVRSWYALAPDERSDLAGRSWDDQRNFLEQQGVLNSIPDDRPATIERLQREYQGWLQGNPAHQSLLDSLTPQARDVFARQWIEGRALQEIEPQPVAPRNLDRFAATLPQGLLASLDPLPAEAARYRLRILYRLAFPAPEELPSSTAAEAAPPDSSRGTVPEPSTTPSRPLETTPF